ncbi:MAG: TonB-dependent receptor plug domain-containing protein, partial [Gemmatimonadales bacterium]
FHLDRVMIVADSTTDLVIALAAVPLRLAEIVVWPGAFALMGAETAHRQAMTRVDIESAPQLGEDIFRAVARLPGLTSGDYTAHFSIRGGRHDETLILFDGLELYEPFHLKDFNDGAISIIDVETIDGVELLTGGFSAKYGDRRSGVFSLTPRRPREGGTRLSLGASLLNARVGGEGTFAGGKGSWLVSARRGYIDLLLGAIKSNDLPTPTYADAYTTLRYQVHRRHTLALNALWSQDRYRFDAAATTGFQNSIQTRESASNHYGNSYLWLTANSILGSNVVARSMASAARVSARRSGSEINRAGGQAIYDLRGERAFSVVGFKQDLTYERSSSVVVEGGYDLRRLDADYSLDNVVYQSPDDPSSDTTGFYPQRTLTALSRRGTTLDAYLSARLRPIPAMTLEFGGRYERASHTGDRNLSPRVNLLVDLGRSTMLRAGWGHYRQRQAVSDLAALAGLGRYYPSELSTQATLGLERTFRGGSLRVEGYLKRGSHLRPVFRNWKNSLNVFPETDEDRILVYPEASTSRGVEVFLTRDFGASLSFRGSYALASATERASRIDNVNQPYPLRFAATHPWPQDQRHTLNLDLAYRPHGRWSVQASFVWHSGWPATLESLQQTTNSQGQTDYVSVPQTLYGSRLPGYQRLDLRVIRRVTTSRGSFRFFLEVNNLTNHQNLFGYDHVRGLDSTGAIVLNRGNEVGFPIFPSIGFAWSHTFSKAKQ